MRKAFLPAGTLLFVTGLTYAGLPGDITSGISLGLDVQMRMYIGALIFAAGSALMWFGRNEWTKETYIPVHSEYSEIRKFIEEKRRENRS